MVLISYLFEWKCFLYVIIKDKLFNYVVFCKFISCFIVWVCKDFVFVDVIFLLFIYDFIVLWRRNCILFKCLLLEYDVGLCIIMVIL